LTLVSGIGSAGFAPAQQEAISGFASDVATAIFAARRRQLTGKQATKAKAAVDYFAERLIAVADDEYSAQLDNEQGLNGAR